MPHSIINGVNGHSVNGNGNGHNGNSHAVVKRQPTTMEGFSTKAIHIGSEADEGTGAVVPPLNLASTYKQSEVGVHKGFEYSRSGNPNRNALERTLASIEAGGEFGLAFSSGSATTATIIQSLGSGGHILSVNDVYGGTRRYMTAVAPAQGVETTFLDLENASEEEIIDNIRPNTKMIWIESPTNPTLRLIDIAAVSRLAHAHPSNPLVLVDNTFLSPFYSSPILLGADIVIHSLTKYVNGHSDVVMGAAILPAHRAEYTEKLRYLQNAIGAVPSPFDSWLAQRGAKTLGVRMKAHGQNAVHIARVLEKSPYIKDVIYPGLSNHPRNDLARRSLSPHASAWIDTLPANPNGDFPFSGMLSVRLAPGVSSHKFLSSLQVFTLAESLGGIESLAELPAEMTHAGVPESERQKLGIGMDLVRLSVGIEEVGDLVRDLEAALEAAAGN